MIIKVCGMSNAPENEALLRNEHVNWFGTIQFPASSRFFPKQLNTAQPVIGVFVNPTRADLESKIEAFELAGIQLHGSESPEFCAELPENILRIKAFSIEKARDFSETKFYEGLIDYFLFDTKTANYGGSGQQFDWNLIENYSGNTPFLISGGIDSESIERILNIQHPQFAGVDLNSRFELSPGIKDAQLVINFIANLKTQRINQEP